MEVAVHTEVDFGEVVHKVVVVHMEVDFEEVDHREVVHMVVGTFGFEVVVHMGLVDHIENFAGHKEAVGLGEVDNSTFDLVDKVVGLKAVGDNLVEVDNNLNLVSYQVRVQVFRNHSYSSVINI